MIKSQKKSCLHSGSCSQSAVSVKPLTCGETVDSAKAADSRDGRAGQHKIGISSSISRNLLVELKKPSQELKKIFLFEKHMNPLNTWNGKLDVAIIFAI